MTVLYVSSTTGTPQRKTSVTPFPSANRRTRIDRELCKKKMPTSPETTTTTKIKNNRSSNESWGTHLNVEGSPSRRQVFPVLCRKFLIAHRVYPEATQGAKGSGGRGDSAGILCCHSMFFLGTRHRDGACDLRNNNNGMQQISSSQPPLSGAEHVQHGITGRAYYAPCCM